jgi:Flp pilus assembly protein TadG
MRAPLRRPGQAGQSLAEFALVIPILLMLIMGTVDGGRALFVYVALQEAAQEGALYASHAPDNFSAIVSRVRTSSTAREVVVSTVTRMCPPSTPAGTISIRVSHNLPVLTPLARAVFGPTIPVSATVNGTIIRGSCS